MEKLEFKPEIEQRTLWFFTWIILLVLGTPAWLVPMFFIGGEGIFFFAFFLSVWLVAMIIIPIWIPAAFRALEYEIDEDGVKMKGGVVWKKHVTVPYSKITNVDITRGPLQRHYKIGTIHVQTAGSGGKQGEKAELKLTGIKELEKIRSVIIDNIKGIDYSGAVRRKIVKESPSEEKVFEEMLSELKDIKKLMGKDR